jgi:Family of unknown function (DUF6884)/GIY-YIG catalytic domain
MLFTLDGESFELTPELVRAGLSGAAPENIQQYWAEVDGVRWPVKQVISLATGVRDRQRFQSQSARRWLSSLGFTIGRDDAAVPAAARRAATKRPASAPAITAPRLRPDVVLIGCVKSKLSRGAAAKDLYVSDYFMKMRGYAEATRLPWFILSAEHGLVSPDDWLEPYERYLPDAPREYRRAWGEQVVRQLRQAAGPLDGLVLDIHAGAAYVDAVQAALRGSGARVIDQLQGLSFGRRLSWYRQHPDARPVNERAIISQLRDPALAMTLEEVLASRGAGLRAAGMYSWWVDEAGAAELSAGLGHEIQPGIVYAGLAGATRSGGSSSANTLWGRIATMHLGKNHQFSTFRLSLGSILACANGQTAIDEVQLTRWMHAHLRVLPIPVDDADSLGDLETGILAALDPPLNLAKVERTPLRQRLSVLRKQYGGVPAADDGGSAT